MSIVKRWVGGVFLAVDSDTNALALRHLDDGAAMGELEIQQSIGMPIEKSTGALVLKLINPPPTGADLARLTAVAHHAVSATLSANGPLRHTNLGATDEVVLVLPPAMDGGNGFSFCNLSGFNLKVVIAGSDVLQWGQAFPAGAQHLQSSEQHATLRLEPFATGLWHAVSAEGTWTIGG